MMRSMYSGVSGLKVHQTKMDVIGNNISNVNTVGFKSSSVTFTDVLYQTISAASGPNEDSGMTGMNAKQIGLGATVSAISTAVDVTGGSQRTDNAFDVMIEGDAFFVVNNGSGNRFTKAGSFMVDADGTLCNATGYAVMGWQVDGQTNNIIRDTVSPLKIMSAEKLYSRPQPTKAVHLSGNIDGKDSQVTATGGGVVTNFSIYDNLGQSYTVNLKITQTAATNEYTVDITDVLDSTGKSIVGTADFTSISLGGQTWTKNAATGTLTAPGTLPVLSFDASNGDFTGIGAAGTKFTNCVVTTASNNFFTDANEYDTVNGTPLTGILVDFSSLTQYANSGTTTIEPTKGTLEGYGKGNAYGEMTGVSIDASGIITGVYDNGQTKVLGQIAVATFANAAGLESAGGTLFNATQNSGEFDGIGVDVSTTGGKMNTGVLEMSNVDLAGQFTEMITAQRGFQANSRIITTTDTLLEELINLKR